MDFSYINHGPQCYQEHNKDQGLLCESHYIGHGTGVALCVVRGATKTL